jgi:hypothetical protein
LPWMEASRLEGGPSYLHTLRTVLHRALMTRTHWNDQSF